MFWCFCHVVTTAKNAVDFHRQSIFVTLKCDQEKIRFLVKNRYKTDLITVELKKFSFSFCSIDLLFPFFLSFTYFLEYQTIVEFRFFFCNLSNFFLYEPISIIILSWCLSQKDDRHQMSFCFCFLNQVAGWYSLCFFTTLNTSNKIAGICFFPSFLIW